MALYSWEPVRAYHAVWPQQVENSHVEWDDSEAKLQFCHALVWHTVISTVKVRVGPKVIAQRSYTFAHMV